MWQPIETADTKAMQPHSNWTSTLMIPRLTLTSKSPKRRNLHNLTVGPGPARNPPRTCLPWPESGASEMVCCFEMPVTISGNYRLGIREDGRVGIIIAIQN